MKKIFSVIALFTCCISVLLSLSGCAGGNRQEETPGASFPAAGENTVTGVLSSVNGNTLEIELIDMAGMPGGGERPDMGEMPDGWQPGEGGTPPDGQFPDLGGEDTEPVSFEPPAGEFPPDGETGEIPTTGESMTVEMDGGTVISDESGEELTPEDLEEGALLRVELSGDGKTAVSIGVMRRMRGSAEE